MFKQLTVFIFALFLFANCQSGSQNPATTPTQATPSPTATPFVALPQDAKILQTRAFTSSNQKNYTIQTVKDDLELEQPQSATFSVAAVGGDTFSGTARKAAKLSIANAPMETFDDLEALIASLPPEPQMANHVPPIRTTATSNRVIEEKRNVHIRVFLYAASKEKDNDFHLILGRAPGSVPAVYLTMELSGLPSAGSAASARLKAARNAFKAFFGSDLPGTDYDFYTPPIPVEIEGSLFFDASHISGQRPGPTSLRSRMPVIWEVHPISKIVFEP